MVSQIHIVIRVLRLNWRRHSDFASGKRFEPLWKVEGTPAAWVHLKRYNDL